MLHSNFNQ